MIHIYSGCQNNVPIGEALVASAVVRLPILSVLRLALRKIQARSVSVQAVRRNPGANSGLTPSNSLAGLLPVSPSLRTGSRGAI
jgi:hypothetical protein